MKESIGFLNTAVDVIAQVGETFLYGLDITASLAAGAVTIYEGLDASSGRRINTFKTDATFTTPIRFNPPLYLQRGLFIDVGANIEGVTVYFKPVVSPPKSPDTYIEP